MQRGLQPIGSRDMGPGCFVSVGRTIEQAVERVKLAESLGYDSVYCTQTAGRDALTVMTAYALATSRIRVGTGVVPIYTRTPATMAQTAATIGELSGGRFVLGVGVSHRPVVEGWYGQTIDKPVAEMKEYVAIVRAILTGEAPPEGRKFKTAFQLAGYGPFPDQPVYGAALSPAMLRAVGEVCDGVVLWLCTPDYIRDVVVPEVATGRERAGKSTDGFDVVAAVPGACTDDRDGAYTAMRRDLLPYFGLPFYRAMIERSGFGDEIAAFDEAAGRGECGGMRAGISDRFTGELGAIGDGEAGRSGVRRYADAGPTTPSLGPIAGTD